MLCQNTGHVLFQAGLGLLVFVLFCFVFLPIIKTRQNKNVKIEQSDQNLVGFMGNSLEKQIRKPRGLQN